jgi:hypothetical protein
MPSDTDTSFTGFPVPPVYRLHSLPYTWIEITRRLFDEWDWGLIAAADFGGGLISKKFRGCFKTSVLKQPL